MTHVDHNHPVACVRRIRLIRIRDHVSDRLEAGLVRLMREWRTSPSSKLPTYSFRLSGMKPIQQPDSLGHWGRYGGRFVPETLMAPLEELTAAYEAARADESFQRELDSLLRDYAGRPTPLFFAQRLTQRAGGARIYLNRKDTLNT